MTTIVVDDHLLGDVLGGATPPDLAGLLLDGSFATTNLYYYRLCRAALSARGGALTGSWSQARRQQAASRLVALPPAVDILPMRSIAVRMAELARDHRISALGAEAVAATEMRDGRLCVWEGDDGPAIRACCESLGVAYQVISRD